MNEHFKNLLKEPLNKHTQSVQKPTPQQLKEETDLERAFGKDASFIKRMSKSANKVISESENIAFIDEDDDIDFSLKGKKMYRRPNSLDEAKQLMKEAISEDKELIREAFDKMFETIFDPIMESLVERLVLSKLDDMKEEMINESAKRVIKYLKKN